MEQLFHGSQCTESHTSLLICVNEIFHKFSGFFFWYGWHSVREVSTKILSLVSLVKMCTMRSIFTLGHNLILPYFPYLLSNLGEIRLKTSALFAVDHSWFLRKLAQQSPCFSYWPKWNYINTLVKSVSCVTEYTICIPVSCILCTLFTNWRHCWVVMPISIMCIMCMK